MLQTIRRAGAAALPLGVVLLMRAGPAVAQPAPVAAMFSDDQKRHPALASSFLSVEMPATKPAAFPVRVSLSAGDLERAFDSRQFRPDAAIVPTNTDLAITAAAPATQRVLIDRVQQQPDVLRDLNDQIAARRKQTGAAAGGEPGLLRIGQDIFVAQLARAGAEGPRDRSFPNTVCLIATDFATGGAIDRRELFVQDRLRKGIAECLAALDAAGATSLVVPLVGAASAKIQANDALYEGQRILKECRLINSTAGIALGIHDFAARRRSLREIGVVQWDQEIVGMFEAPAGSRAAQNAQAAYRQYAEQIQLAFNKGLKGQKTTESDVFGSCSGIFTGR
jgi:hypothetical protein